MIEQLAKQEQKNFFQLYSIDSQPLLEEVIASREMFGSVPLRTSYEGSAHREVADILLRGPEIRSESTLEELQHTIPCINYNASESFSACMDACFDLMYAVKGVQLGRVIITKLPAGGSIYPHVDEGEAADFYSRYHIVINGQGGNTFFSGDEEVEMLSGDVWWINNHIEHSVENKSGYDRIHLICDIRTEE